VLAGPAHGHVPACPRAREPGTSDILAILQTESSRLNLAIVAVCQGHKEIQEALLKNSLQII
jgi:hypothetical protein